MKNGKNLTINLIVYSLIIIVSIWIIYIIVYGRGGILERRKIIKEINLLKGEISQLVVEKKRLTWEYENLRSNKKYIEALAHSFGYRFPEEKIYKFFKRRSSNVNKANSSE